MSDECPLEDRRTRGEQPMAVYCPYCGGDAERQSGYQHYKCKNSGETFLLEG
jgi:transposase-like protein